MPVSGNQTTTLGVKHIKNRNQLKKPMHTERPLKQTNKASKSNTPRFNQTIGLVARSVRRFRPV